MSLPSPPAPRLAYDVDGSIVVISRTATSDHSPFVADTVTKASLNTNQAVGLALGSGVWGMPIVAVEYFAKNWVAVVFPRLMDITAVTVSALLATASQARDFLTTSYVEVQTSNDTTNGQDGSWVTVAVKDETDYCFPWTATNQSVNPATLPPYDIGTGSAGIGGEIRMPPHLMYQGLGPDGPGWMPISGADGVQALRLFFPTRSELTAPFQWMLLVLHLYGVPHLISENRLDIVNNAGTASADLGFGDIDVTEYVTRTVRVRNRSVSEEAVDVRLSGGSAGVPVFFPPSHYAVRLSLDGEHWLPQVRLGNIPAGGLSPGVLLRADPVPGMVGLHFARAHAFAGGWS